MKTKLLSFIFVCCCLFAIDVRSYDERETFNSQTPSLKAGQMFSVKIIPAGNELDILISGNRIKKIVFADVELIASIQSGERQWPLSAQRRNGLFRVAPFRIAPFRGANTSNIHTDVKRKLKIEVRHKGEAETFDFDMKTAPR